MGFNSAFPAARAPFAFCFADSWYLGFGLADKKIRLLE